jgi:hypothetical protein
VSTVDPSRFVDRGYGPRLSIRHSTGVPLRCSLVVALVTLGPPHGRGAEPNPLEGFDVGGEKRKCLHSYEIAETRVLDASTVLFRVGASHYFINRLSRPCPELLVQRRFKYTLRGTNDLCSGDVITVIDGVGTGPVCILGEFEAATKQTK